MGWRCRRCICLRILGPSRDEPRYYRRCRTRRHRQYCTNARFSTQWRPARQMDWDSPPCALKQCLVAAHNMGRQRCWNAVRLDLQWLARWFSDAILLLFACRAATPLGSCAVTLWLRGSWVQFGAWTISHPVQSQSTK